MKSLRLLVTAAILIGCTQTVAPITTVSTTTTLAPLRTFGLQVTDPVGLGVPDAVVSSFDGELTAAGNGMVMVTWPERPTTLAVTAPGFVPEYVGVSAYPSAPVEVSLEEKVLEGSVVDTQGRPVAGAIVSVGGAFGVSDTDGIFQVRRVEPGEVLVRRPAWAPVEVAWPPAGTEVKAVIEPKVVRALHIVGSAPGEPAWWEGFLRLGRDTEINGLMVDLKDESGYIFYDSEVEEARTAGAIKAFYDLETVAADAKREGLYLIGRIVTFQDPVMALHRPDRAVRIGDRPYRAGPQYFLDPTDAEARAYGLSLAKEACAGGFDEIQFDYVRFPDGFPASARFDLGSTEEVRVEAIRSFLEEATTLLHPMGCAVAADIFGFLTSYPTDGGIGQQWETVATVVDVLSPMLYPSHYDPGWFGFTVPNDHPGPVVSRALDDGLGRLASRPLVLRPWLQDFWYTAEQVRAEIDAAEARGLGWMLWNAGSNFTEAALASDG